MLINSSNKVVPHHAEQQCHLGFRAPYVICGQVHFHVTSDFCSSLVQCN